LEIVVFVPGIMGSELFTSAGEKVWPPTPLEVVGGYRRIDKLLSADLTAKAVISSACIDVYAPLLKALGRAGYGQGGSRRLMPYPYDWRRDLSTLSDELDAHLTALVKTHGRHVEIKLVCHSMGGLVARGCLEAPRAAPPVWSHAVRLCVFMATPHDGAPLAFARAIGASGGDLGLSAAQLRQVAGAAGFPAGYQLFPPEDLEPIWSLDEEDPPLRPISLFSPEIQVAHGLNPGHLTAARAFRTRLDPSHRPAGCRYVSIVSTMHETVTRFDQSAGAASPIKLDASGDGTVPLTSAAALRIQTAYVKANHIGVTQKSTTHELLEMLLGVREPSVIAAAVQPQAPVLSISTPVVSQGEAYEIVIEVAPGSGLQAQLRIEREEPAGTFALERSLPITLAAEGAQRLSLRGPLLAPGRYRFRLDGPEVRAADPDAQAHDAFEDLVVTLRPPD